MGVFGSVFVVMVENVLLLGMGVPVCDAVTITDGKLDCALLVPLLIRWWIGSGNARRRFRS